MWCFSRPLPGGEELKSSCIAGEETRKRWVAPLRAVRSEEGSSKEAERIVDEGFVEWREVNLSESSGEDVRRIREDGGRSLCLRIAERVEEPNWPVAPIMASLKEDMTVVKISNIWRFGYMICWRTGSLSVISVSQPLLAKLVI